MFSKLMDAMFGCRHARYSFPITVRAGSRRSPASRTGTYVVCLDCGKRIRLRLARNEDHGIAAQTSRAFLGYERSRVRTRWSLTSPFFEAFRGQK